MATSRQNEAALRDPNNRLPPSTASVTVTLPHLDSGFLERRSSGQARDQETNPLAPHVKHFLLIVDTVGRFPGSLSRTTHMSLHDVILLQGNRLTIPPIKLMDGKVAKSCDTDMRNLGNSDNHLTMVNRPLLPWSLANGPHCEDIFSFLMVTVSASITTAPSSLSSI